MFCTNCGHQVTEDSKFCPSCETSLTPEPTSRGDPADERSDSKSNRTETNVHALDGLVMHKQRTVIAVSSIAGILASLLPWTSGLLGDVISSGAKIHQFGVSAIILALSIKGNRQQVLPRSERLSVLVLATYLGYLAVRTISLASDQLMVEPAIGVYMALIADLALGIAAIAFTEPQDREHTPGSRGWIDWFLDWFVRA